MKIFAVSFLAVSLTTAQAANFYVATSGSDSNTGTQAMPFRTIQHAADIAQPGDVITVSAGIYRESINPPRGGLSDSERIVYQAAPGQHVVITGSEIVTNWVTVQGNVWKATLPDSFFGDFNPYTNVLHGDWFRSLGRIHHTGSVYLNGQWLSEAKTLNDVLNPREAKAGPLWLARVDNRNTTIWAQLDEANPNQGQVEINVRQTVFYPKSTGINYITVSGFTMEDAATPWAPPTAEQMGLIGTHWSKGWIIESNTVRYSMCCGIALGKYGDEWDNRAESAVGYVGTIKRALTNGWNKATVGGHVVRGNDISHCEQTGIVGSMGGAFSTIEDNNIHDIHVMNWFSGAEMAGIKLHGAVDVIIQHNHISRSCLGVWLDWMAQGTRVSGNLFDNNGRDVFLEVDHGPFLLDNNLFLSAHNVAIRSQGGAFVQNLFAGTIDAAPFDGRETPFFKAHSTILAGFHNNPPGDVRFYNNIFFRRADLQQYDKATLPVSMAGNVFLNGAKPSPQEKDPVIQENFPPFKLVQRDDQIYLQINFDKGWIKKSRRELVTTQLLGKAIIPNLAFEQRDGAPLAINTDYLGRKRNKKNPAPGPFAHPRNGQQMIRVW